MRMRTAEERTATRIRSEMYQIRRMNDLADRNADGDGAHYREQALAAQKRLDHLLTLPTARNYTEAVKTLRQWENIGQGV